MLSVPSILEDILRLPGRAGLEALQELEVVAIGGAAMKENVGNELVKNGVNLLNHWGKRSINTYIGRASISQIDLGFCRCYRNWCYRPYRACPSRLRLALLDATH